MPNAENPKPRLPQSADGNADLGFGISSYAQRKPCFDSGSERTRTPLAAKIAFVSAGMSGGSDGSPRPVGGLFDFTQCTSICGGACAIRSSGTWWKLFCTAAP